MFEGGYLARWHINHERVSARHALAGRPSSPGHSIGSEAKVLIGGVPDRISTTMIEAPVFHLLFR
jgi:hypothetical protein